MDPADEEPVFDQHAEEELERDAPRHHEIAEEWDSHEPLDLREPPALDPAYEPPADEVLVPETPPPSAADPPERHAKRPGAAPGEPEQLGEETAEYDVEAEELKKRQGRGRARGDAGIPPGRSGPRPAVVRAAASARLRLRGLRVGAAPSGAGRLGPARAHSGWAVVVSRAPAPEPGGLRYRRESISVIEESGCRRSSMLCAGIRSSSTAAARDDPVRERSALLEGHRRDQLAEIPVQRQPRAPGSGGIATRGVRHGRRHLAEWGQPAALPSRRGRGSQRLSARPRAAIGPTCLLRSARRAGGIDPA